MQTLKMLLLSDANLNPMIRLLATPIQGVAINAIEGPYGQVHQILMNLNHPIWEEKLDAHLVWTSPEKVIPSFQKILDYEGVSVEEVLKDVDDFCDLLIPSIVKSKYVFVVSWSVPPHYRWMQTLTNKHNLGLNNILMQMNLRLSERLHEHKQIIILDSMYWYAAFQQKSFDAKMYAVGKIPYTRNFFAFVAREINSVLSGLFGKSKKLIICDLDNTLWGGIIGDDGMENIRLGGIDPIGESFKLFQQELKRLSRRGILLAVSSKNNEKIALEMMEQHPEMILRKKDFSAWRINWEDKATNILGIAEELHLGLQSIVFLDDNPSERDRVKQALPEVYVPSLPEDFTQYPIFIQSLDCFETSFISQEDRVRVQWFQQEQQRQEERGAVGSLQSWLRSLELKVTARRMTATMLPRVVQLLNKTNQFNMATRRFQTEEYWTWSNQSQHETFVFEVEDKFGTAGYTGVISFFNNTSGQVDIHDFVMSCRVMGKGIEEAILFFVKKHTDASLIKFHYVETEKNKPFYDFISNKYRSDMGNYLDSKHINMPDYIKLIEE